MIEWVWFESPRLGRGERLLNWLLNMPPVREGGWATVRYSPMNEIARWAREA